MLHSHSFQGPPESTTQKGTFMKCAIVLKVAAVAVVAGLAGCQDLKPLQADVADLKSQVAKLQSDVAAAKSSADQQTARHRLPTRLPAALRALPTRRWLPLRRASRPSMPPTRRSTGCSSVRSRSKPQDIGLRKRRAPRGVFFGAHALDGAPWTQYRISADPHVNPPPNASSSSL